MLRIGVRFNLFLVFGCGMIQCKILAKVASSFGPAKPSCAMLQSCPLSQCAFVGVMVAGDVIASVIHPKPCAIPIEPARVRAQLIFLMSQRPLGYDGVARWLTSHAACHGQADPMLGKTWLPAGEVRSYFALYKQDMLQRHGVTQAGVSRRNAA